MIVERQCVLANSYTFQTYSIPYTYVQQYHMISRALCQPSHQLQAKTHSTTRLFDAFWQPSHPMQASLFRLGARRALLKPGRVSWLEVNQPVVRLDSPILWYHPLKGLVKCISMLSWSSLYINWNIIGIASSAPPRRVAGLRLERRRSVTVHPARHKNIDAQKSHHFSWFPTGFLSDILSCTNHACSQTHRSPISQGNKQLGSFAVGKNLTSRGTCRKRLTLLPNLSSLKMPAGYQHNKISHRTMFPISCISTVKRPLRYHAVLWCKYVHLLSLCLTSSWILSRL